MKRISDKVQRAGDIRSMNHHLLARKLDSGEVGIMIGYDYPGKVGWKKGTTSPIYWNNIEDAIEDLEAVVAYYRGCE